MKTEQEQIKEITETLLAHEPIIDVPYEQINDIAIALVQEGYGDVKQAQIDVLTELQEKYIRFGATYAGWILFVPNDDIDEMIEELKK